MTEPVEDQPASRRQEVGRRTFMAGFAFFARALQQVSVFAITLLAARYLLPAEYGIYNLGMVFVLLIQTLTYTGLYHFVVVSKEEDQRVLSTSFWMILGLSTAAGAVVIALAYPIADLFDAPDLAVVLILLILAQPLAGIEAWQSAAVLRRENMRTHFLIMFLTNSVSVAAGVVLMLAWQSVFALVAFRWSRVITGNLLYAVLGRDRPSLGFDKVLMRNAFAFASGLYGSRVLTFLSQYSADLLLGFMFSPAATGLYRFGNRVATGATDIVTQPLTNFALTQFGAASRKEQSLEPILRRFIGTTVLLTGGVSATIIVLAPAVVHAFFQPAYLSAMVVTYALAARAVLGLGTLLIEPVMAAAGKTGAVWRFNLVWTLLLIVVVFVAARHGLAALAWSQAGISLLSTVTALLMMRRVAGIPMRGVFKAFAIAGSIIVMYGLGLEAAWLEIQMHIGDPTLELAVGFAVALALGLVALLAGLRLRVFSLAVFSG